MKIYIFLYSSGFNLLLYYVDKFYFKTQYSKQKYKEKTKPLEV